jgi:hypothetical protein
MPHKKNAGDAETATVVRCITIKLPRADVSDVSRGACYARLWACWKPLPNAFTAKLFHRFQQKRNK